MVTVLTSAGNLEGDVGRMPGTDTGDLTETLVCLTGKLLDTPSVGDTLESTTLGSTNDVKVLVHLEDGSDWDGLLEEAGGELKLLGDGATVNLDFHDVSLLLTKVELLDLSVGKNADDLAVLGHAGNLGIEVLLTLRGVALLKVLAESFLLGGSVVLVEAAKDRLRKLRLEDSGELTETTGSLEVTDDTEDNHGWGLDNGDSLNDLLLMGLGTNTVHFADNMCHTSLITHKNNKVGLISLVVPGEAANAATMVLGTLLGEETKMTTAWCAELTMRHG
jgi:hypothetical protein